MNKWVSNVRILTSTYIMHCSFSSELNLQSNIFLNELNESVQLKKDKYRK